MKFMMMFKDTPKNLDILQKEYVKHTLCGAYAATIWQGGIFDNENNPIDKFLALCFYGTPLQYILVKAKYGKHADVMKGWPSDYEND